MRAGIGEVIGDELAKATALAVDSARVNWRRNWLRVGKAEMDVEIGVDMVEEKLEVEKLF